LGASVRLTGAYGHRFDQNTMKHSICVVFAALSVSLNQHLARSWRFSQTASDRDRALLSRLGR